MTSTKCKVVDLTEFADPIEVWKAIEGRPGELIDLLRGDQPIRRRTREALADWLTGDLKPVKIPRGAPPKHSRETQWAIYNLDFGHDVTTEIGLAGLYYEFRRRELRKRKEHLNRPNWTEALKREVAERHRIPFERFETYLRRARPKPKKLSLDDYIDRQRLKIAREIRSRKINRKD